MLLQPVLLLALTWIPRDRNVPTVRSVYSLPGDAALGTVDTSIPIKGVLYLMNTGGEPRNVLLPPYPPVSRVKIMYPKALQIPPGGYLEVPWEYDGHGDVGQTSFKVAVQTDDPLGEVQSETYSYTAINSMGVTPFRSAILVTSTDKGLVSSEVSWEFVSGGGPGGDFIYFEIEDPTAPLSGSSEKTLGGGLRGTLKVDPALLDRKRTALSGETKVFGVTYKGDRNYFWVQWRVN